MLGRLILIALQIVVGWVGAPFLLKYVPIGGDVQVFIHGAIFAVLVWITGVVGSLALKEVGMPSSATLTWALAGGLIGAALIVFKVPAMLPAAFPKFPPLFLPLGLSILGYAIKK